MSDPVGPDPLPDPITPSGLRVGVVDVLAPPPTSGSGQLARLNYLYHADDGSNRLFVNDNRGPIWLIDNGVVDPEPFLDLRRARDGDLISSGGEQGLRSFAFHPDFERPGTPGYGKFYTLSTETVASAEPGTRVFADSDPSGPRAHDVLAEWRIDADDPSRIDVSSRREVLRIEEKYNNHNSDQLLFDPNARPGDPDYGLMYLGTGDGGGGGDPLEHGQDPGRAQGKILRIDPLEQADGSPYGVPDGNPFADDPDTLPEIWALGLRHPQNLSFDTGGGGRLLIADIGQGNIEEVNLGVAGANYGWQEREGTFATREEGGGLDTLPDNDAQFGFTYPVAQYDHDEGRAITGGFVYRGDAIPELSGQYLFGDIVNGRIFHVPVGQLRLGQQAEIEELTLDVNGRSVGMRDLVGRDRVDLRFGQDEDGELYVTSKQDGLIRKLVPIEGETVNGTGGNDTLTGSAENDRIFAQGGNDIVSGLAGDDLIRGAAGDDRIAGRQGDDRIQGGAGNDMIEGNADDDALYGEDGADTLLGGLGDDGLSGWAGPDRLDGGEGADVLFGHSSADELIGGAGRDRLQGGAGDDVLRGGLGDDLLAGQAGRDRIVWTGSDGGADTVLGFARGEDRLELIAARTANGTPITRFDDLDSSGDGRLTGADDAATVQGQDLTLTLQNGGMTLVSVAALNADDFLIA